MIPLPAELVSSAEIEVLLPSRRSVGLPRARFLLSAEGGPSAADLRIENAARAMEQVIRCFRGAGWVCVRLPKGTRESGVDGTIPAPLALALGRLGSATRAARGVWDLGCVRGDQVLFITLKQAGRDRLRLAELAWAESALLSGVPPESLLVLEWSQPSKSPAGAD